jgi:Tol biopolymer transport system component
MLAAGTKLGPYEIVGPLGAGGMGEVYRARDTRLGRDVAVKVLPSHLSGAPELRQRFEREARAVSSLNHPHICTLHDVGREGGTDYLVMEMVEGETLGHRLERGPLPAEQVLKLGIEIADALERAHRSGIVHRDLKPGNVMLTKAGAKLMDFGLARATGMSGSAPGQALSQTPTVTQPLTAEGTIVGTFQYMAPEQLEGKEADARSDLWALGTVLYEMATGKKAFEGRSQASLIAAIMNSEPKPISALAPMSPPALDRLVKACLAKDPDERLQAAHDVRLQLEWIRDAGSQAGLPAPVLAKRKGRERLAWIVAGVMTLVVVAGAALSLPGLLRRPAEAPLMRFAVTAPEGVNMQEDPPFSAISPDGRAVVFVAADSSGAVGLWVRPIGSLAAQTMSGTDNATFPFWSPDGRFVGFFADGKLKKVAVSGGAPEVLCDAADGRGGAWSKDGTILFAPVAAGPIHRISADGGEPVEVMRPDSAKGETGLRWPEFLPDGKHYLFVALPERQGSFDVYLGSLGSQDRRLLLGSEAAPVYVPPGILVLVRNGRLMAQRFDPRRLRTVGAAVPLGEAPPPSLSSGARAVSASATGILAHPEVGLPNTRLEWLDRTGKVLGTVPLPAGRYEYMSVSPDGQRLAVGRRSSATAVDLWTVELARGVASRFTFGGRGVASNPVWSPDGRWIAYNANPTGSFDIYRKAANGAEEPEVLHRSAALFKNLSQWTHDGRYLIFGQPDAATGWDVWALPVEGDRKPMPVLRSRFNEYSGAVSPDGKWIVYTSDESGRQEAYVQSFPTLGNKHQISTGGALFAAWSSDGREIALASPEGTLMVASVTTAPSFAVRPPRPLFRPPPNGINATATPDFQRILLSVAVGGASAPSLVLELNWMSALKK